ncbi:histidine phosphatase family protein [Shouchella patagoniensis]|uniref:histidine phosphatase family protein n=1 Tax=Shouchella patagoniensis TaxID=228576 RepID=UPI000995421F|nr:histidine phosphatase family protein [Shouchella patagoniensis]
MSKSLYLVRHAEATGQDPDARLTKQGEADALSLVHFFENKKISSIISSPYERAVKTIAPSAKKLNLPIKTDERLKERVLTTEKLMDWESPLKESFLYKDSKLLGGETSNEATQRILAVCNEVSSTTENTVLVTHGNLLALLLNHYNPAFGFSEWKKLRNPDIFRIDLNTSIFSRENVFKLEISDTDNHFN